jgi:hypothetical protein
MIKFQLYYTDEYNQSSILANSEKLSEIIEEAKRRVTEDNVNNSLTVADKERNWESYFVEITSHRKEESLAIHAGKNRFGRESVYLISKDGITEHEATEVVENGGVKVYLGNLDKVDWYAKDARNNEITKFGDENLNGKACYYIKAIEV